MANEVISTVESNAIIPEVWSAKFYDVLLPMLPFNNLVSRDYEGEIANLGDIVNISTIPEFGDAGELAEGAAADADKISITGQQLVINKRIHKDYIITKKSQLQSLSFMDGVRDKAIFSIMKRMQAVIIAEIIPSASAPDHQIAYDSGSTLALADLLEAKELLDLQDVPDSNRQGVMGAAQWNDLFNITGFTSRDFIPAGSPLTEGSIKTPIAGFLPRMTTEVGSTSYWFHPSFMTMAVQDSLNIEVFNLGVDGVRGSRVNVDLLMGVKQLDNKRVVTLG